MARIDRPFDRRELALASVALGLIAVLALGPHLRNGGFYSDDWANAAGSLHPPGGPDVGKALSYFADHTIYRPVLVVYVPLMYFVLGMHMHYHLAWAAFLAVLAATMLYGALRTLGLPWIHALLIGALTIVFPWSDSTRLWATGGQITLSIAFMATGLLVALVGLRRGTLRWHLVAAALYLLSILTYEVTLPLIACLGGLYCLHAGWRVARARWLMDLAAVAAGGIWVGVHTKRTTSGLGADLSHLRQIVDAGGTILGRAGMPLGSPHTALALCAIAAVLGAGLIAYVRFPARFDGWHWGLGGWLGLAGAGLVVAALGWVMFIPADPYYTPSVYGATNRVNGLAAFGLILVVYGTLGVIAILAGQMAPKVRIVTTVVSVLLATVLLASYVSVLRRHIRIWDAAFVAESSALREIEEIAPRLRHGTTVLVGSYPANQTLGVPIISDTWGLKGMVRMEYDDMSLSGYPALAELRVVCGLKGVALRGASVPSRTLPYGKARFLNLQRRSSAAPRSQRDCQRVADGYEPGPLYLSLIY
jgi:hypothetical protein